MPPASAATDVAIVDQAASQPASGIDAVPADVARLLRIQEVAAETGLTPRSIRYYEEVGLLRPAARSQGAYRLYDGSDLERLRFIRGLRDDAGFSLAEIGLLLEDEDARIRDRQRFAAAGDLAEKRVILRGLIERVDRQVATLEAKAARLREMVDATTARRAHLQRHLEELEGGPAAHRAPNAPADAAPGDAAPGDAVRGDAVRGDAVPGDAAPAAPGRSAPGQPRVQADAITPRQPAAAAAANRPAPAGDDAHPGPFDPGGHHPEGTP